MAVYDLVMPKMGESIMEATIISWAKNVGDAVEVDETILEIATDKVDSEIPSPVSGILKEIRYQADDVVSIGEVIAVIQTGEEQKADSGNGSMGMEMQAPPEPMPDPEPVAVQEKEDPASPAVQIRKTRPPVSTKETETKGQDRFYSPLVRNIANRENISPEELDTIPGTGLHGRVTKKDLLNYIEQKEIGHLASKPSSVVSPTKTATIRDTSPPADQKSRESNTPKYRLETPASPPPVSSSASEEIIEMDRMRKMIAEHMVFSKRTSPHVTSFVEADVTEIVRWREKVKDRFYENFGTKLTYTPIFIEAVIKAIQDFPMINISVDGDQIIVKKNINIGMATALPSGNLIVPVIKNADNYNLKGLVHLVNDYAERARNNQLKPDEIQGGTFTLTNVGTFGNVMGTPIINQPQVAILATGAIRKKPSVVTTQYGDLMAIRHMMFLSLSYDHRVVDGFLGGSFLRKVADYLEQFNFEGKI